jgi:arylsulfatase A-like enzyme
VPANAPKWLAGHPPLTAKQQASEDAAFRLRVQEVQSVDRMIGALRQTLEKAGVADRTLVVFSSDNGYHLGEHRLGEGKQTAFDTDVNVPLVIAGPGIAAGRTDPAVVQNIDLRPTFDDLAGAPVPAIVDGHSILPLLKNKTNTEGTRKVALVEHLDSTNDPADPDFGKYASDIPPTYHALRSADYTYVEYADGSLEYYDRARDPEQMHNAAATLTPARRAALHAALQALKTCRGQACWAAGRHP